MSDRRSPILSAIMALLLSACASHGSSSDQPCQAARDCQDGFVCAADHQCHEVDSTIGQACRREQDCGPGQTCTLTTTTTNRGRAEALAPTCQAQLPGGAAGTPCTDDSACQSGVCAIVG
jgi:uncharacterized repeat protein (TIGR01451 family)